MTLNESRTYTTLFLIQSLDGKITTGDNDSLDTDSDFSRIVGIKEGLQQYYNLERETDRVTFNSGRVMEKVGMNEKVWVKDTHDDLSFVIIDNKPHLTIEGCEYFARRSQTFYLITTNINHPGFGLRNKFKNIVVLFYKDGVNFRDAFEKLKRVHGVNKMTIQTGGEINAILVREKLIDEILIVVAPCLIGGKDTQSLIGGESLHNRDDLRKIGVLKLKKAKVLNDSYLLLNYGVLKDTVIENNLSSRE